MVFLWRMRHLLVRNAVLFIITPYIAKYLYVKRLAVFEFKKIKTVMVVCGHKGWHDKQLIEWVE